MVTVTEIIREEPDLLVSSDLGYDIKVAKSVDSIYNEEHISFIQGSDIKAKRRFERFVGNCLIVSYDFGRDDDTKGAMAGSNFSVLIAENPRLVFMKIIKKFFYNRAKKTIHPSAQIGENVEIGEGTTIHANVVVYDGVKIGKYCKIKAGAVLGGTGFGYEMDKFDEWINFPHIGGLVIGNNVDIGSNTNIDRGTLDDTIIRDGVKIDNGVHIAHNVFIDEDTLIIANTMIAGSVKIGKKCWIAPMVTIRDDITIGDSCFVGLGAVVVKDISDAIRVKGFPAKPFL